MQGGPQLLTGPLTSDTHRPVLTGVGGCPPAHCWIPASHSCTSAEPCAQSWDPPPHPAAAGTRALEWAHTGRSYLESLRECRSHPAGTAGRVTRRLPAAGSGSAAEAEAWVSELPPSTSGDVGRRFGLSERAKGRLLWCPFSGKTVLCRRN